MAQQLLEVFWLDGVENIEEIISRRALILGILVGEEGHHGGILLELRIEILDRDLVVVRDLDLLHRALPQQLLLASQNILEKVLVDHWLRWQIELETIGIKEMMLIHKDVSQAIQEKKKELKKK